MKIYFVILFTLIFFIIYQYGNYKHQQLLMEINHKQKYNIHGMFMNEELGQRNKFTNIDSNIYIREKQGESRLSDQTWIFDNESKRYLISIDKYASVEDNKIFILQNDSVVETLYRVNKICSDTTVYGPTYSNIEEFKLVHVHHTEYKELEKLISTEKVCSWYNDWNLPVGTKSNEFMSRGAFVIHPTNKFYFYVQPNILSSILSNYKKIKKEEITVDEIKKMSFGGCM